MTALPAPGAAPAALLGALLAAATAPRAHRTAHSARATMLVEPGSGETPQSGPVLPAWALALLGAAVGALVGVRFGWSEQLPAYLVLPAVTAPLVAIDLAAHQIPDRLLTPAACLSLILLGAASAYDGTWQPFVRALLAASLLAMVFLAVAITAAGGFGLADTKFSALMGLWLGYQKWNAVALGVLAAFLLAAMVACALVISGRVARGDHLALGPFLVVGTTIALVAAG
jgi:leader peptidase (prepilin peptidase) / N-methyltransferase